MVALGEQVTWKVPSLTQLKLGSKTAGVLEDGSAKRRGRTKTSSQTPTECTLPYPYDVDLCSRWSWQKVKALVGTPWEMMPKKTKLMEPRFPRNYIAWAVVQRRFAWRTLA